MENRINLSSFTGDAAAKLRAAGDYLRENPGTTLVIEAGRYIISYPRAKQIMEEVYSGAYGYNPQPVMFRPDFPYDTGLKLENCRDITVEAYGAVFMIDGYMEPVCIRNSENVTVRGLTVDYLRKPYARGIVLSVDADGSASVQFDDNALPTENMSLPRQMLFDSKTGDLLSRSLDWKNIKKEQLSKNVWRLWDDFKPDEVGADMYLMTTYHFVPCIRISHDVCTALEDVTIHCHCGMGVVGFKSRDISMNRLRVYPSLGHLASTNTDATHFACCSGTVSMENCVISGQGDDAINIHSYYYTILNKEGNKATVRVITPDGTHCQEPDYPTEGYVLELVNKSTLAPVGIFTVVKSSETEICDIVLDRELPDDGEYLFANRTDLPRLIFRNNYVSNHLARSVLCKTHHAVIENNYFRHNTGTAVHIAAESWWSEGINAEDVIVRNNIFERTGFTVHGRTNNTAAVSLNMAADDATCVGIHKDIVIENNTVDCGGTLFAFNIANATGVILRGNKVKNQGQAIACIAYSENVEKDFSDDDTCYV